MWVQLLEGLQNAGHLCRWREGMAQRFQQQLLTWEQHPPCSMDLPDTWQSQAVFLWQHTRKWKVLSLVTLSFLPLAPFLFLDTQSKELLVSLLPLSMQGAHSPAVGQEISIRCIFLLCCAQICYWKNYPSFGMMESPPVTTCQQLWGHKKKIHSESVTNSNKINLEYLKYFATFFFPR